MPSIFDQTTTTSGVPWQPLQNPLLAGVTNVQNLFNQGTYQGPYTAGVDPSQVYGYNLGTTQWGGAERASNNYAQQGQGLIPGLGSAFNYYQGAIQNPQGQNPWLTNNAQYMGLANQFADNPYMDQSITAALRDPYRQLTEQTLPGIRTQANQYGVAGGSQEAVMSAIADRGYQDRAADVGAQMRGQAWNQGLGIANQAAQGDQLLAQNAASNLAGLGGQGLDYLSQSYGIGQQGAQDLFNWGTQNQNLQNQQIQGNMAQYYAPWQLAQSYGSYINPLAGSLQSRTGTQDGLGQFLLAGLGPTLGSVGGDLADAIPWDSIGNWLGGLFGGGS
jgi:hypothetical protein